MLSWLPENIATYGLGIDHVLRIIFWIVFPWFMLAEGILFYFILRYRRKKDSWAVYESGTNFRALAWILLPAVIVLGFDLAIEAVQTPVWDAIKIELPTHPDQVIRVTGKQFVWEFTQAGRDNQMDTADDIQTLNQLTVPVHAKIQFELQAADVLHSLWIPNLRLKQDAVPGRTIKGWFEATREGVFPIACAELCGSGHGMMRAELHVLNQEDFEKWLQAQTRS